MLSIKELLHQINYPFDNLYIDRFWNSIKDDKWIYLDNEMILWLEYKDIKHGKEQIIKLLRSYLCDGIDYKILNNSEFNANNFCSGHTPAQNINEEKRGAHNKQYITLSPDCFKELCMHVGTAKSKEIKKYYIELEKVFKFYLEYQNEYRKIELNNKNMELEEKEKELIDAKDKIMDMSRDFECKEIKYDEFIYIATNESYHKQNVYKIGRSLNLNKRKKQFNTFFIDGHKVYYIFIFQCHNSRTLENLLFTCLDQYKYCKINELFHLELNKLYSIVYNVCCQYTKIINDCNNFLLTKFDKQLLNDDIIKPTGQTFPINYNNIKNELYDEYLLIKYINNKNLSNVMIKDFVNFDLEDHILVKNKALSIDTKTKYYYFSYYEKIIYVCTNCGCFKKDKRSYEQHIRKRNKCMKKELCLNTINDIENEIENQNIKLYSCKNCKDIIFKTYDHYKRHINNNCKISYNDSQSNNYKQE